MTSGRLIRKVLRFVATFEVGLIQFARIFELVSGHKNSKLAAKRKVRHHRKKIPTLKDHRYSILFERLLHQHCQRVAPARAAHLHELRTTLSILGTRRTVENRAGNQIAPTRRAIRRTDFEITRADWTKHQHRQYS